MEDETESAKTQIILAREWLADVAISDEQIKYLATESLRGRVQGHRAEVFSIKAARALAALEGRAKVCIYSTQFKSRQTIEIIASIHTCVCAFAFASTQVQAEDLRRAVELVVIPRSIYSDEDPPPPPPPPEEEEQEQQEQQQTQAEQNDEPPPPPEASAESEEENQEEEEENKEDDEDDEPDQDPEEVPEEFVFDPEGVVLDSEVMQMQQVLSGDYSTPIPPPPPPPPLFFCSSKSLR